MSGLLEIPFLILRAVSLINNRAALSKTQLKDAMNKGVV
jgi:hypothetical protein